MGTGTGTGTFESAPLYRHDCAGTMYVLTMRSSLPNLLLLREAGHQKGSSSRSVPRFRAPTSSALLTHQTNKGYPASRTMPACYCPALDRTSRSASMNEGEMNCALRPPARLEQGRNALVAVQQK